MTPDTERHTTSSLVEVRSTGRSTRTIGGYAAVFGKRSQPLGAFVEIVEPSFFRKSQGDSWPGAVCRFEHNPLMLLGTTASGTLRIDTDPTGLVYEVDLPESRSDVYESVSRRDITSSSFAFQCYEDEWKPGLDDYYPTRHLISGRLIDVAPTSTPAYPDATASLRSLARYMDAPIGDVEDYYNRGELRKLFVRTDLSPLPVPAQAVQNDLDLRRRVLAHRQRGVAIQCDEDQRGYKPRDNIDLRLRLLESRRLGAEIESEPPQFISGWPGYRSGYHQQFPREVGID